MNRNILLVEDNPDIMKINRTVLLELGYRVLEAETLQEAWAAFTEKEPDLIVLDIMLPDGSGLAFCQKVREQSGTPILFLTALGESGDIVKGLMSGGDDYLTKPYDLDVFCARVYSLLRRVPQKAVDTPLTFGELELKGDSGRAYLKGRDLLLTTKEHAILKYLAQNSERYVRAEELYRRLWGMDDMGDVSAVWTHISRIRRRFGEGASIDILSKRGQGYRLVEKGEYLAKK